MIEKRFRRILPSWRKNEDFIHGFTLVTPENDKKLETLLLHQSFAILKLMIKNLRALCKRKYDTDIFPLYFDLLYLQC